MATEANRRAVKRYDAKSTKQYHLKLNLKSDAGIIVWLEKQDSMQGYIKRLIWKDMPEEYRLMGKNRDEKKVNMKEGNVGV